MTHSHLRYLAVFLVLTALTVFYHLPADFHIAELHTVDEFGDESVELYLSRDDCVDAGFEFMAKNPKSYWGCTF